MNPIRIGLTAYVEKLKSINREFPIPPNAFCPECQRIKLDYPGIEDVLENRGVLPAMARCICEDKMEAERLKLARRVVEANLPHQRAGQVARQFDNFLPVKGSEDAFEQSKVFAKGTIAETILVLIGTQGCGKSHLVEAVARHCLADGMTVRYELVPELLDRLRSGYSNYSEETTATLMDSYRSYRMLVLDDLGLESPTEFARERLTSLVDERYRNGGLLVVATNQQSQQEMAARIGPRLAERLWDTVTGTSKQVYMTCPSYRTVSDG